MRGSKRGRAGQKFAACTSIALCVHHVCGDARLNKRKVWMRVIGTALFGKHKQTNCTEVDLRARTDR